MVFFLYRYACFFAGREGLHCFFRITAILERSTWSSKSPLLFGDCFHVSFRRLDIFLERFLRSTLMFRFLVRFLIFFSFVFVFNFPYLYGARPRRNHLNFSRARNWDDCAEDGKFEMIALEKLRWLHCEALEPTARAPRSSAAILRLSRCFCLLGSFLNEANFWELRGHSEPSSRACRARHFLRWRIRKLGARAGGEWQIHELRILESMCAIVPAGHFAKNPSLLRCSSLSIHFRRTHVQEEERQIHDLCVRESMCAIVPAEPFTKKPSLLSCSSLSIHFRRTNIHLNPLIRMSTKKKILQFCNSLFIP